MIRRVCTLAVALMATGLIVSPARADEPTKILLIGKDRDHPPRSHEYMAECALLAKCLTQTPGVEAVVSNGWPTDPAVLDGVDAIVCYTSQAGNILSAPERREQVEALLKKGVGLVCLHWGTGADEGEPGRWQLANMGAWFNSKFSGIPVVEARVLRADPAHPIVRGVPDWEMRDEYYTRLKFLPDAKPILHATVEGKDETLGWAFERPGAGGRSFGFVCGHFHDCFRLEPFRRAVVNGILWAAGRDVPEGGAPVAVSEEDLTLPPDPRIDGSK